jgi:hypothetical protein
MRVLAQKKMPPLTTFPATGSNNAQFPRRGLMASNVLEVGYRPKDI